MCFQFIFCVCTRMSCFLFWLAFASYIRSSCDLCNVCALWWELWRFLKISQQDIWLLFLFKAFCDGSRILFYVLNWCTFQCLILTLFFFYNVSKNRKNFKKSFFMLDFNTSGIWPGFVIWLFYYLQDLVIWKNFC